MGTEKRNLCPPNCSLVSITYIIFFLFGVSDTSALHIITPSPKTNKLFYSKYT